MLPAPDDGDKTILRPAFEPPTGRVSSAVDSRQIGALAAINPIVAAANPLLMTISLIRSGDAPADVDALRTQLIDWIKEFDAACGRAGIPEEQQHLARYALCTVLDETIQVEARRRTAWSHVANWAQHSLLLHCFGGNWGGKEFFLILDKLVQAPARYMWLLQLFYICLSLGFMGQFLMSEHRAAGQQQIADLRERLYQQVIRAATPEPDRTLSVRWRGLAVAARQFQGFTALWLTAGGGLLFCVLLFMAYTLKLDSIEDELHLGRLELAKVAPRAAPAAAPAAPVPAARPRLAQLLAPQVAARQLGLSENEAESVVTLTGELAFDSGSPTPSAAAVALIERVAEALEQVKGQIVVTGYTDNVRPRSFPSFAFRNNHELSLERARAVAAIVRAKLTQPARVLAPEGRGESNPIESNGTPEGRALNRRVEIALRPDTGP